MLPIILSTHGPGWLLISSHRIFIPDSRAEEEKGDFSEDPHSTVLTYYWLKAQSVT